MSLCAPRDTHERSSAVVDRERRRSTVIAVAGLAAGIPSMLTRPAPISSAACCRERASPRRTSSASTRARRVTVTRPASSAEPPFSTDSSACTSRSCASSSRAATASMSTSAVAPGPSMSGSSASNAAIWARISSGSVLMSMFTLVDRRRQQGPALQRPLGRCRRRRRSSKGCPPSSEFHTAFAVARTTVSESRGSLPVDCTVTAAESDVDPPRRVRSDPQRVGVGVQGAQIGGDVVGPFCGDRRARCPRRC